MNRRISCANRCMIPQPIGVHRWAAEYHTEKNAIGRLALLEQFEFG